LKKADHPTLLVFAFHEILPGTHSPYFAPGHEPSLKTGIEGKTPRQPSGEQPGGWLGLDRRLVRIPRHNRR
jgi:hypothetical protein